LTLPKEMLMDKAERYLNLSLFSAMLTTPQKSKLESYNKSYEFSSMILKCKKIEQ
jgi:hypothetical protein